MPHDYQQELSVAVEAVRSAGKEVAHLRAEGVRYGTKGGAELVSEADLRAAEMLHQALTGPFPDTAWLSEEHEDSDDRLDHERVWIVDPIDGTREYLQGIPEYAVSVALVVAGDPVLGVVYNPASDELFQACCAAETSPASTRLLTPATFVALVGRGEQRYNELPPLPAGARVAGVGSVAYRLALLSSGKGDAVLTGYGRAEWDVAAGVALCRAKGITVSGVLGDPLLFNKPEPYVRGLLAAEPALHAYISEHFTRL